MGAAAGGVQAHPPELVDDLVGGLERPVLILGKEGARLLHYLRALIALACAVGCIGGIYGIGGGSIPAPVLIGSGLPAAEVAPAALASTFVTSVAGVATFTILSLSHHGPVAPDWPTGIALGLGGLAGTYTGARLQARMPDTVIRRIVGILVIVIGGRYLWSGLS